MKPEGAEALTARCTCDEGGPLGFADQAVIPNHPELLALRALVVSVRGKGRLDLSGESSGDERK